MPTPTKKIQLFFPLHRLLHSHRTQPQTRTTAPNPSAYSNKVLSQPRALVVLRILPTPKKKKREKPAPRLQEKKFPPLQVQRLATGKKNYKKALAPIFL